MNHTYNKGRLLVRNIGKLFLAFSLSVLCLGCTDADGLNINEPKFTIYKILPAIGKAKDTLTIHGIGFADAEKVLFNGVEGNIVSRNEETIKVIIPKVANQVDSLVAGVKIRVYSPTQYRERTISMKFSNSTFTLGQNKFKVDTVAHHLVGPGANYTCIDFTTATDSLRVYYLTMQVGTPNLRFEPVLAKDTIGAAERVIDMGPRKTAQGRGQFFAGVNADFFRMNDDNRILDGMAVNGQLVALPIDAGGASMIVERDGRLTIDELNYVNYKVILGGTDVPLNAVNDKRGSNQLVMYNSNYGTTTHTNNFGTEVIIKPLADGWSLVRPVEFEVTNVINGGGNSVIPEGCAVLSGHGSAQNILNQLQVGDKGKFSIEINALNGEISDPLHILGVKPMILKKGAHTSYVWDERHPRTALGLSQDKRTVYFCVVDGRQSISKGVTVTHLADLMKRAGAFTAFNLDGGGSSTMYVYNDGYNATGLMNRPNGGTYSRSVANAFYAVADVPDDNNVSQIASADYIVKAKRNAGVRLRFCGMNRYGLMVDNNLSGVQLTVDPAFGTIEGEKLKVTGRADEGEVTATYQGATIKVKIVVEE